MVILRRFLVLVIGDLGKGDAVSLVLSTVKPGGEDGSVQDVGRALQPVSNLRHAVVAICNAIGIRASGFNKVRAGESIDARIRDCLPVRRC